MKNERCIPTNAPARISSLEETGTRFWHWTGISGTRYIASIYDLSTCPPLPGAVYVAARGGGKDHRQALACGLIPRASSQALEQWRKDMRDAGAEEIHLHLLASSPAEALRIRDDIRANLGFGDTRDSLARRPRKSPRPGLREAAGNFVLCG